MVEQEKVYAQAFEVAERFLARWPDCQTRNARDDLAQEAAVAAWRCRNGLRHPRRFDAFVRTISRRLRYREMYGVGIGGIGSIGSEVESFHEHPELLEQLVVRDPAHDMLRIGKVWIEKQSMLARLERALSKLGSLNRQILRGFYEGFSCSELADRYSVPEGTVKVRLYRSRRRLRAEFADWPSPSEAVCVQ